MAGLKAEAMEDLVKTVKELEVVSDDEDEVSLSSTSDQHLENPSGEPDDHNTSEEPTYRVAWDSSQSRSTQKPQIYTPTSPCTTQAEDLKEQGNAAFRNGDDTAALHFYNQALQHCCSGNDTSVESTKLQATLYSNISAVFLRLNRPSEAISAANQAHSLCPDWTRPLHRLAEAHFMCEQYVQAVQACQKGEILCHFNRNSEGHTEFSPVLDRIALRAAASTTSRSTTSTAAIAGFTGRQLEVRSAGEDAWLGRPAPHDPELDGPLNEETALPSDDLSTSTTTALPPTTNESAVVLPSNTTTAPNGRTHHSSISAREDTLATWHSHSHRQQRTSFRCIQEAISAAQDGDRILLLRGVHNGMGQSININKRVLIEGQGELGETVIDQRANCPTFRITRGGVVVRNLDIDHTGFREALLIAGKSTVSPLIENCILKCSGDDVVNIAGKARPFFRRCVITGKKCGIRSFEQSKVSLESCIMEKCGEQAVKAMENSKIDATLCTLRDCEEDGVVIMDKATVSFLACNIQGNVGPGVDCSGQGKLEMRGGEISKNDGGGIFLWDASSASLDGARIDGGLALAILSDESGRVNSTSCVIKGTIHASEEARQGILKVGKDGVENILKNKLIRPDGPKLFPAEEGPFRFVPNKYTRKQ